MGGAAVVQVDMILTPPVDGWATNELGQTGRSAAHQDETSAAHQRGWILREVIYRSHIWETPRLYKSI